VQNEVVTDITPTLETQLPGLQQLWAQTLGDPRICIAILDGPVDLTHPSLRAAALTRIDLDEVTDSGAISASDHGTHVTSVIFGSHDGPVKGIAPKCRGLIIPIFRYAAGGSLEPCSQERLSKAIRAAVRYGANVINISAGQFSSRGEASAELRSAIKECGEDALIVAAAGNEGCDCLHVPGALPQVLAVGAMNAEGRPLEFSNWGEAYREHGVLAPGQRILGAAGDGGVKIQSGTSFSTPIVSGVAGLLLSLQQQLGIVPSSKSIRSAILKTSHGCDPQTEDQCERVLVGRLSISGSVSVVQQGANIMQNATNGPAPAEVGVPPLRENAQVARSSVDSVEASGCCEGCDGKNKQLVYAIGEVDYDFPSLSRLHSLQHSMAVLTSTGKQLQVQNKLDFARHLSGFAERRIDAKTGGILEAGIVPSGDYKNLLQFTVTNGAQLAPEDDKRCILINEMRMREGSEPMGPWLLNGQPLRIGYVSANTFCIIGTELSTEVFDTTRALWILPQHSDPQDPQRVTHHPPHRYDASSVTWKLRRGSTNLYAIEPADSFSEDAYDELVEFLLESLGYGRGGLDIYYFGWGESVQFWPGDWDPCFNTTDCCFDVSLDTAEEPSACCKEITKKLSKCCDNYQNKELTPRERFVVTPKKLARNLPKSQRVAVPGRFGGESVLMNGEMLREIVPDMRGTLSWSIASLLDLILGPGFATQSTLTFKIYSKLRHGLNSLLQHFDRRIRNPGISSADRALNYAATRLQAILEDHSDELIDIDTVSGKVSVFELDDILPPTRNHIGPPGSDCWDVEIAFFNPADIQTARVIVAQTIDVSDGVPHLVEAPKVYRRR